MKKIEDKVVQPVEPPKPVEEPKKKEPPMIEAAPLKAWTNEKGEQRWVFDKKRLDPFPLRQVAGVQDSEIAENIITSAVKAISPEIGMEKAFNVIIQSAHDFKPRDAIEARLAAQAAVAYQHAMEFIKRGANQDMLCHLEPLTNLGIKFLRVHNETVEALSKYRRGGEQRVIVQHVAEKMAVVNNFGPQGGGATAEKKGDTSCSGKNAEPGQEPTAINHVANRQCPTEGAGCTAAEAQAAKPKPGGGA